MLLTAWLSSALSSPLQAGLSLSFSLPRARSLYHVHRPRSRLAEYASRKKGSCNLIITLKRASLSNPDALSRGISNDGTISTTTSTTTKEVITPFVHTEIALARRQRLSSVKTSVDSHERGLFHVWWLIAHLLDPEEFKL